MAQVAIKTELEAAGFTVLREKQTTLTEERSKEFYRRFFSDLGSGLNMS